VQLVAGPDATCNRHHTPGARASAGRWSAKRVARERESSRFSFRQTGMLSSLSYGRRISLLQRRKGGGYADACSSTMDGDSHVKCCRSARAQVGGMGLWYCGRPRVHICRHGERQRSCPRTILFPRGWELHISTCHEHLLYARKSLSRARQFGYRFNHRRNLLWRPSGQSISLYFFGLRPDRPNSEGSEPCRLCRAPKV